MVKTEYKGVRQISLILYVKQKTAYEIVPSLVGSEMYMRDRCWS